MMLLKVNLPTGWKGGIYLGTFGLLYANRSVKVRCWNID